MARMDRIKFEESKFNDLIDGFIDKNTNLWNQFVDDKYQEYLEQSINYFGDTEDDLYDREKDKWG